MNNNIMFIALSYAHENYFTNHFYALESKANIIKIEVDKYPFLSMFYRRRGLITIPLEVIFFVFILFKYKPSVVVTAGPKLGLILSIVCKIFPKTKHAHWFTGQVWGADIKYKYKLSYWCDVITSIFSNVLMCDGESQKKYLIEKIPSINNIIVPEYGSINGVSERFFSVNKKNNIDFLTVCFVGRKAKGKGIERILKIADKCRELNYPVKFIVAGPNDITFPDYNEFKKNISPNSNNIEFIDDFVDPISIFECSDVLILPSDREGFGSVVIEAQASGLVVLCSDIYGLRDSFIDQVTGFRCFNNDIDSYLDAICKLMDNDTYKNMSREAITFSARFSPEIFIKSIYKCYVQAEIIKDVK